MPYRERKRACPNCKTSMQVIPIGEDNGVDLCPTCGGVFIDFFDGDPVTLAGALMEHLKSNSHEVPSNTGHKRCPDCQAVLHVSLYGGDGPGLSRCLTCMGIFLSNKQVYELLSYDEGAYDEEGWVHKIFSAIKALLK